MKKLSKSEILLSIIKNHKSNGTSGIYSVCSANKFVLKAAIDFAKKNDSVLLIEATSNQVDQFGGYMGMNPKQYKEYIDKLLTASDFSKDNVILGGDHLGPNTWQSFPAKEAMENAKVLISEYVKAGFKKIHLDTCFVCADDAVDGDGMLPVEVISERAAELCEVAEKTIALSEKEGDVVYIIGTEVPKPGGMDTSENQAPEVSTVESTEETINITRAEFKKRNLQDAWSRVIAVVTQPGVEFGDKEVFKYDPSKSRELVKFIEKYENLVYEAHSTDYQSADSLKQLVKDHFAILKVGPALTFALREILFKLEKIEIELYRSGEIANKSNLSLIVNHEMLEKPEYWINHYTGTKEELDYSRIYSLSDRIRYYWPNPKVSKAISNMMDNLSKHSKPTEAMIEKYLPDQFIALQKGFIPNEPEELIGNYIQQVITPYSLACGMSTLEGIQK